MPSSEQNEVNSNDVPSLSVRSAGTTTELTGDRVDKLKYQVTSQN